MKVGYRPYQRLCVDISLFIYGYDGVDSVVLTEYQYRYLLFVGVVLQLCYLRARSLVSVGITAQQSRCSAEGKTTPAKKNGTPSCPDCPVVNLVLSISQKHTPARSTPYNY